MLLRDVSLRVSRPDVSPTLCKPELMLDESPMPDAPCQIMAVDDSPTQLLQLKVLLKQAGYEVCTAGNAEAAIEMARQGKLSLVVTDLEMPGMSGLDLVKVLSAEIPSLPVVLTTSRGSEELAVEALQAGAASYVPKHRLGQTLIDTVERTLAISAAEQERLSFAQYIRQISLEMEFGNDDRLLQQILSRIEAPLIELGIVTDTTRMHIGVALDEALRNAMIHGNLEVSSELRDQDDGSPFMELIQQRLADPQYADRRVSIQLTADQNQATIVIADQGPGFDVNNITDPTDPDSWEEISGRGLFLIRSFMDEVQYNESGNQITMIKYRNSMDSTSEP